MSAWAFGLGKAAESLQTAVLQYGYMGVFAVSLLGSVVPFVPLPYLAVVVLMSGTYNPLLLGLAAGAGGAVGKVTSYALGRLGYLAAGEESKKSLESIHSVVAKYGMLGVFVFALTPLPDDVYVIPMGVVKLPFWRFFVANLAGKLLLSVSVAYLGSAYFSVASALLGGGSILGLGLAAIATIVVSYAVVRCDWMLAIEVMHREGTRGLWRNLPRIARLRRGRGASEKGEAKG